jgi:hypothetical protein
MLSILALSVGVNHKSLRTTAFGIFRVTVSTHGVFIACISLDTLFFNHSVPHFTSACPYFPVLLATAQTAGAITFPITGQAIHHTAHHVIPHRIVSDSVASLPLSSVGRVAPNHAPTTAERHARLATHFAHHTYPPPTGSVSAVMAHVLRALFCCSVRSHSHALVTARQMLSVALCHSFREV